METMEVTPSAPNDPLAVRVEQLEALQAKYNKP